MCVDIDFRLFSGCKAEKISLRYKKKTYIVVKTFFPELCFRRSVIDEYSEPTEDN